jgi:hypothetical protein
MKIYAVLSFLFLIPCQAMADGGIFEISAGISYSRSNYANSNYSWNKRIGASFGYHLSQFSEIELAFQDVYSVTVISGFENTTFHDQVYSLNWVQSLLPKSFALQPYVKIGVGQLNREASGTYGMGLASPPAIVDSVTAIIGAGLRIYLTRTFAIRAEASSYLTGGAISTWRDNVATNIGLSYLF